MYDRFLACLSSCLFVCLFVCLIVRLGGRVLESVCLCVVCSVTACFGLIGPLLAFLDFVYVVRWLRHGCLLGRLLGCARMFMSLLVCLFASLLIRQQQLAAA